MACWSISASGQRLDAATAGRAIKIRIVKGANLAME